MTETTETTKEALVNSLDEIRLRLDTALGNNGEGLSHNELMALLVDVGAVASLFATALDGIYNAWGGKDNFLKVLADQIAQKVKAEAEKASHVGE